MLLSLLLLAATILGGESSGGLSGEGEKWFSGLLEPVRPLWGAERWGGMLHPHCFLLAELRSRGCDLPWVLLGQQVPGGRGGRERQHAGKKQSLVLLESQVKVVQVFWG